MYIPVGFWLNFEVGGDLSLGESFDTLLKEDNRYLFDAVGKAVKLVSIVYVHLNPVDLVQVGRNTMVNACPQSPSRTTFGP